jgi:hypothetical protein
VLKRRRLGSFLGAEIKAYGTGGYDAELANFRKSMNLGISQGIVFVPIRVLGSSALRKDCLDAFFTGQGRAFSARTLPSLAVESVGPIFLSVLKRLC